MNWVPPIDSVQHVCELRRRDSNHTIGRRWPDEAALLQPLGVERHAEPVMPKNLNQVTSGASEDVKIAGMRIAPQGLLNLPPEGPSRSCRASYPFVQPQARPAHQRESGSSSLQHVEHTPQCLRINAAADADTILAGKINLDGLRDSRWLRGDGILSRCNQHRDQLRSRRHGRPTPVVAIALPPIEYLVRVHVILPSNYRDRRARRKRRRNDLPLQRLGPRAVTRPTSRGCAHNRFCGHFLPSQHQESHHTR